MLREIEKHKDEAWTEQDFDIAMHDDRCRDRYEEWCRDMWWVLVQKDHRRGTVASPYSGDWERYGSLPTVAQLVREADGYGPGRTSATSHSSSTGEAGRIHCNMHRGMARGHDGTEEVDPDDKELPDAYQIAALRVC